MTKRKVLFILTTILTVSNLIAQPQISSISNPNPTINSSITISGTGFSNSGNVVYVDGMKFLPTSESNTSITFALSKPVSGNGDLIIVNDQNISCVKKQALALGYSGGSNSSAIDNFPSDQVSYIPTIRCGNQNTNAKYYRGKAGVGDLNNDGNVDYYAIGMTGHDTLAIKLNNGNPFEINSGSFTTIKQYLGFAFATGFNSILETPYDFDFDGDLDLLLFNDSEGFYILYNDGNLTPVFTPIFYPITHSNSAGKKNLRGGVLDDFDGDGKLDIAAVSSSNTIYIVTNTTSTVGSSVTVSFNSAASGFNTFGWSFSSTSATPIYLKSGDIDNDGKPDLIYTIYRYDVNAGKLYVGYNASSGGTVSFTESAIYSGLGQPGYSFAHIFDVADLDSDGDLDFAIAPVPGGTSSFLHIVRNDGSGVFTGLQHSYNLSDWSTAFKLVDVNGDGKRDILWGIHNNQKLKVVYNTYNSGTLALSDFSSAYDFSSATIFCDLAVADFNGDSKMDVLGLRAFGPANNVWSSRTFAYTNMSNRYYLRSADISNISNWNTSASSSGSNPVDFSNPNAIYVLDNDFGTLTGNVNMTGKIRIMPGSTLNISGTLGNVTGQNNVEVDMEATSASSYAQLLISGTAALGTVKQAMILSLGHHGISSPMTTGFTTTSGTANTLYGYNANTGAWDMSPTVSTVGAGFFAPVQSSGGFQSAAGNFSVTGTPNTSHTHSLGYAANTASGGSGSGWNLIGNPYTCGLDWTSVTKTNVNNAYYVWDASNGTYQYYSGSALSGTYLAASSILSGVIPPMQAFWVQATASGGSIVSTMANDGTVSSSPTFYKTSPDNMILYAEDLNDPSLSDAMWITHAAGYTNDFEGDLDAWKRSNYGGQANIYSYHDGEKMAINALDLSATTYIPVGVKGSEIGKKYRLVLEQLVNNQPYQAVLEDKLLNSFSDITSEGYVFTYGAWQNEEPRFVLHVNQSTVGIDESTSEVVKVYQQGDRLVVLGDGQKHSSFTLVGLDGRVFHNGILTSGMASMPAPKSGVYIIQLHGTTPIAQRVVIQ